MPTVNLERHHHWKLPCHILWCLKSSNTENKKCSDVALGLDDSSAAPHHAGLSFFLSLHHFWGSRHLKHILAGVPFFALS